MAIVKAKKDTTVYCEIFDAGGQRVMRKKVVGKGCWYNDETGFEVANPRGRTNYSSEQMIRDAMPFIGNETIVRAREQLYEMDKSRVKYMDAFKRSKTERALVWAESIKEILDVPRRHSILSEFGIFARSLFAKSTSVIAAIAAGNRSPRKPSPKSGAMAFGL